ncbi:hypothetical protein AMTR_s00070p00029270 [Amborella trichopoda]|uniref:Uncharacterized protein n=1 Tax=Amborella trichopoda TaxID=13333 RepID=U5DED4_AMBTC|nr:hypothetical protein AMTR_s00070p00029270 [Amborella trichopoda]
MAWILSGYLRYRILRPPGRPRRWIPRRSVDISGIDIKGYLTYGILRPVNHEGGYFGVRRRWIPRRSVDISEMDIKGYHLWLDISEIGGYFRDRWPRRLLFRGSPKADIEKIDG